MKLEPFNPLENSPEIIERNFHRLADALAGSTDSDGFGFTVEGVAVRFGVKSVTLTASTSGSATVTHGLGKTPACVLGTPVSGGGAVIAAAALNVGATTFDLFLNRSVSTTATIQTYWLAVG